MNSKKREQLLKFWYGCDFSTWVALLRRGRVRVSPSRIPLVAAGTVLSAVNSALGALQHSWYDERVAQVDIEEHPIFVLGHWRTGTTLLHELLMCDERHAVPTTYQCMTPHHFLITGECTPPLLEPLVPRKRPMDDMELHLSSPQEDEFALLNMGLPSPYLLFMFPREADRWVKEAFLEKLSAAQRERWKAQLTGFLKKITFISGKRLVLKSPPHTLRARFLWEIFPKARFIHIVRDPYVVFPSTLHMFTSLARIYSLQSFSKASFHEPIFQTFKRMHQKLKEDRKAIPAENFFELRYEDLVANPLEEMKKLYEHLRLDGFEAALPRLRDSLDRRRNYKTNHYEISPRLRGEISDRWARFISEYGYGQGRGETAA